MFRYPFSSFIGLLAAVVADYKVMLIETVGGRSINPIFIYSYTSLLICSDDANLMLIVEFTSSYEGSLINGLSFMELMDKVQSFGPPVKP